jgi:H+/gluconate symporter-like permease
MRPPIIMLALAVLCIGDLGLQALGLSGQSARVHAQQAPTAGDAEVAAGSNAPSESDAAAQPAAEPSTTAAPATARSISMGPVVLLVIGIASVLAMMIGLKLNAFIALILSALIVSLGVGFLSGEDAGSRMNAVVSGFGTSAGNIGIVIAMASIIGKCMLDSGAADRIVHSAIRVTGEKKAALGLMASGFILAIPVFFDTVFYLLVPLARSLYRRTQKNYVRYVMAIATGGAITHTLVPPTPGPLLVAAILGVDVGTMMLVGALVALPAAIVGLAYSVVTDRLMPIEMRPLGAHDEKHQALSEDKLPRLWISLLPVVLPVVLIGAGTLAETMADREDLARFQAADVLDYQGLAQIFAQADAVSPAGRVLATRMSDADRQTLSRPATTDEEKTAVVDILNRAIDGGSLYDEKAFNGVPLSTLSRSKLSANQLRMKPVDRRRMNRSLLEDAYPELIRKHQWDSPRRAWATRLSLWGNANFALTLAALCAMLTLKHVRRLTWRSLGDDVEDSLMSGGVIILITAAGGAFGAMLQDTKIGDTIRDYFSGAGVTGGIPLLLLGFGIAAILKIAQGSSTVAMIVGAGMMSAIIGDVKPEYHLVYVGMAIGTGSLVGSWMNDSGFWVFAKMGGLTEGESLRSWTPLLIVLAVSGLAVTILLSQVMPLKVAL